MPLETHTDPASGRVFLYDSDTGETRWPDTSDTAQLVDLGDVSSSLAPSPRPVPSSQSASSPSPAPSSARPLPVFPSQSLFSAPRPSKSQSSTSTRVPSPSGFHPGAGLELSTFRNGVGLVSTGYVAGESDSESEGFQVEEEESEVRGAERSIGITDDIVIKAFPCCVTFHSCCCESPYAVVEGLVRCPFYFAFSLLIFVIGVLSLRLDLFSVTARSYFREGALFFAASLTLLIPCMSTCFIYRDFDSEGDWELQPLPTFLGWVDPRRFSAFESGDGALASNYCYEKGTKSMDSWRPLKDQPGILHPPQRTYDDCCETCLGVKLPARQHIEKEVEKDEQIAIKLKKKEQALEMDGWLRVKS